MTAAGLDLWMVPIAILVGAFGTLVGAGGGFLLVPFLLLVYPGMTPEVATSISLAAVVFNALSGVIAYARKRRIDYRSGVLFALAGIPGAALGAWLVSSVPIAPFRWAFGLMMVAGALYLVTQAGAEPPRPPPIAKGTTREITDAEGVTHRYRYRAGLGAALSAIIGMFSSLMGIGGGIVQVPVMVRVLGFPVRLATATSTFVLLMMALTGVTVHAANGVYHDHLHPTLELAVGLAIGAQLGAWLSDLIHGSWIIRSLAVAIGAVGVRLVLA